MSNIAPLSSSLVQAAGPIDPAQPTLLSQVAQHVTVAASLEASLGDTMDKVLDGDADARTLIQLQLQTQALSISTATISQLVASLADNAKKIARQV